MWLCLFNFTEHPTLLNKEMISDSQNSLIYNYQIKSMNFYTFYNEIHFQHSLFMTIYSDKTVFI